MSNDFSSWSVDQVRAKLIELGVDAEEAAKLKPKSVAVKKLTSLLDSSGEAETVSFEELAKDLQVNVDADVFGVEVSGNTAGIPENVVDCEEQSDTRPPMTSPDWHTYVMGQFSEDELAEGNPTVDGLRRVTHLLLGPIVDAKSRIRQSPTKENFFSAASVEYRLTIEFYDGTIRSFCGAADVTTANTPEPYCRHSVASAETKAEGRCLRKALMLRKVITAEEALQVEPSVDEDTNRKWNPDARITREQKIALNILAKTADVNVIKFINAGDTKYASIDDVKFSTATDMLEFIHEYVNAKRPVPPKIKGYDGNWDKGEM